MAKTKTEMLQDIVRRYRESGEEWPATAKQISAFAIRAGLWQPPVKNQIEQCASDIAGAMREEYFTDPQGRRVRKKHPFRDVKILPDGKHEQQYLWIDVQDPNVKHEQVEMAFQFCRKLIAGDCNQLKTSVDSYNDNNVHGEYIEVSFNFNEDMEEAAQPESYPGLVV